MKYRRDLLPLSRLPEFMRWLASDHAGDVEIRALLGEHEVARLQSNKLKP